MIVTAFLHGKDGHMERYICDLRKGVMWRSRDIEWLGYTYRSSIEPLFALIIPAIIAMMFYNGNPVWAWGLKEIDHP